MNKLIQELHDWCQMFADKPALLFDLLFSLSALSVAVYLAI